MSIFPSTLLMKVKALLCPLISQPPRSSPHLHPAPSWLLHPHADPEAPHRLEAILGHLSSASNEQINLLYQWSLTGRTSDVTLVKYKETQDSKSLPHTLLYCRAATWHHRASTSTAVPLQVPMQCKLPWQTTALRRKGCCLSKGTQVIYFDECTLVLIINNSSEQIVFE